MSTTPMHDELALGEVLAGDWILPSSEDEEREVATWTKYERLEGTFAVNLAEGVSVVAVQSPASGRFYIVIRNLEERVDIGEGKTWLKYSISGLLQVVDAEEAKAKLADIKSAWRFKLARDIEGFGDTELPEAPTSL